MEDSSFRDLHTALGAGCLCMLVAGCRTDAAAPDGRAVANAAPVQEADCGGPPPAGAPLPRLESRQLASRQEGHYRFELQYPHLYADDAKVAQKVNDQLLEQLTVIQKRFIKEAVEEGRAPDSENARWFEGTCATTYHSKAFVSVACDTMEGPGAHPNLGKLAYSFQVCPEVRQLALADLCRSLPECRKRSIQLVNEDFRVDPKKETGIQFRDGPMGSRGEPPDMEHPAATLRTFGVTPTGLRFFFFDELPHVLQAFGIVDIPIGKLRPVLREDMALLIWGPV